MEKHRILYASNFGDMAGGGEVSLLGLLSGLDASLFLPVVVCPSEGELAAEARKLGAEVVILPMPRLKWGSPAAFFRSVTRLARLMKDRRVALAHANGSRCAVYTGVACKISRVPMIWHVRILEPDGALDRFLAALSVRIIVNSRAVKERFGWLRDSGKVRVIYNGIDTELFHDRGDGPVLRAELGLGPETPLVGTVGRLDAYKAQRYFIEAARRIQAAVPASRFLLAGGGDSSELRLLATRLGLSSSVIFAGHRRDIPRLLCALDVFVLSSVSEGFGRAAAEAMACGRPVVATAVGGLREVVEDGVTGLLVPPRDPAALADAVIALLQDRRKAAGLAAAARPRAEALFGLRKHAEAAQALYAEVLDGNGPGRALP